MYRVLQREFQQDKSAKEKAEQIDLPKGAGTGETKKKRDERTFLSKRKKRSLTKLKEEPVVPAPVSRSA